MEIVGQIERLRQQRHGHTGTCTLFTPISSVGISRSTPARTSFPMLFRFLTIGALAVTQGYVLGAPAAAAASRAAVSMHFPPINESVDKGNPKVVTTVKCEGVRPSDVCYAKLLK